MITIKNIWELKKAFQSKTNNQNFWFNIVNMIGMIKPVEIEIKYSKELDINKERHYYYRVYFKKESVSYKITRRKSEALAFIIEEAKRLWLKNVEKNNNVIKLEKNNIDLSI